MSDELKEYSKACAQLDCFQYVTLPMLNMVGILLQQRANIAAQRQLSEMEKVYQDREIEIIRLLMARNIEKSTD